MNGQDGKGLLREGLFRRRGAAGAPRSMPPEVTELGSPWRSLVGEIPDLTDELEKEFRFGHRVGPFGDGYRLGGSIKGGSSAIWAPATERQYRAYLAWSRREGFGRADDAGEYEPLREFVEANGIELSQYASGNTRFDHGPVEGRGDIYRATLGVLSALPGEHLRRGEFNALHLGGWGPDSAKASAYTEGTVQMYQFAIIGAKRTYLGLLLHELGHVHARAISGGDESFLSSAHAEISMEYAFVGVEFLLDAESRKVYQQFLADEFLAETYLVYTSQGGRLREFIASQRKPGVRMAWEEVYGTFVESFGGIEYS